LHLFNVDEGATKLSEKNAQLFHQIVAKLLYLCRITRQDIQTAIEFLCTRVNIPDEDDYKQLGQVIPYLGGPKEMTFTIELRDDPSWWVDSAYTMHPDMKIHIGILISTGKESA